jgi:hypothetical protein
MHRSYNHNYKLYTKYLSMLTTINTSTVRKFDVISQEFNTVSVSAKIIGLHMTGLLNYVIIIFQLLVYLPYTLQYEELIWLINFASKYL